MEEFRIDAELLVYIAIAVFWGISTLISFLNKKKNGSKNDRSWISQIENAARNPWDDLETAPEKEHAPEKEEARISKVTGTHSISMGYPEKGPADLGESESDASDAGDLESPRPEKEKISLEEVLSEEKSILSGFIFHEILRPPRSKR